MRRFRLPSNPEKLAPAMPAPRSAPACDALVVGAGPAGAVAARELALAGLDVRVIERARPPRYKTCGGGVVRRALRMFGTPIDAAVERASDAIELNLLGADLAFRVERDEPLVLMTMRAPLDALLLDAATGAGAVLHAGCELKGLRQRADHVEIATSAGELRARYVLACDGAFSATARAAGWPPHARAIPALESELCVAPDVLARFSNAARFDFGLPDHGYAWVFPKRAHLSVGCLSTRKPARGLRAELDAYLDRIGVERIESRADHGFAIPVAPRRERARGRVLLCGDAAGLADPVTCEGITNAALSARLAASSIAAELADPRRVRRTYERTLARELLSELRLARALAWILYERPRWRTALFRRAGQPLAEAMAAVVAGETSYGELLRRPANCLHLARRLAAGARHR